MLYSYNRKKLQYKNGKDFLLVIVLRELTGDRKHQLNKINKILAYPYTYKKYLIKLYSLIAKNYFNRKYQRS